MAIIVSQVGIEGTDIKPDSDEWKHWFTSQPEGAKIQFEWTDDSFKVRKFTAYRRKRYWEAQKRVSGKLRNTTIKPEAVTFESLKQMGYKLTAYNWSEKFEHEESGKDTYQTIANISSQAADEIEKLKAENDELKRQLAELQKKYEHEADCAKRYYPNWRKSPGLESELRYHKGKSAKAEELIEALKSAKRYKLHGKAVIQVEAFESLL